MQSLIWRPDKKLGPAAHGLSATAPATPAGNCRRSTCAWLANRATANRRNRAMPITGFNVHPRGQGTFSRVLGHYVREEKTLDLMTALGKMTLLPAQRLEKRAPMFRDKGRIRIGADADITL